MQMAMSQSIILKRTDHREDNDDDVDNKERHENSNGAYEAIDNNNFVDNESLDDNGKVHMMNVFPNSDNHSLKR